MRRALLGAAVLASVALGAGASGADAPAVVTTSNGAVAAGSAAVTGSDDAFNITVFGNRDGYVMRNGMPWLVRPRGSPYPTPIRTPSLLQATPRGTPVDLHVDVVYEDAVRKGEDLILNRQYDEALVFFTEFSKDHGESAVGPLGEMLVWQSQMLENSDFAHSDEFEKAAKETGKRLNHVKKRGSWEMILESGYWGVKAMHAMRQKHYFRAVDDGWDALSTLKDLKKKEPDLADTGVGLGNYDYWRSVVTENSKWIPFFKNKKKEGIDQLERAFVDSQYTRPIAQLCLVFIYIEEHRHDDAIALAEDFAKKYPHNTLVRVQLGRAYTRKGRWRDAIRINQEVLDLQPDNKVAVYFIGANYVYEGKDLDKAEEYLKKFVKDPPGNDWRGWGNERLGDVAQKRGDMDKAVDLWKTALKDNSDDSGLKWKIEHAHDKKAFPVRPVTSATHVPVSAIPSPTQASSR